MNSDILIQEFSKEKFVHDTVNQICKDFSRCGWGIDSVFLDRTLVKDEIEELLAEKLVEIMKFGETQLLQLIYIIDIPEKEFLSSQVDERATNIVCSPRLQSLVERSPNRNPNGSP
jgi:hypothetical protein